jgi:hypothetical protein
MPKIMGPQKARVATVAFGVVLLIEARLAVSTLVFGHGWPARELVRAIAWALIGGVGGGGSRSSPGRRHRRPTQRRHRRPTQRRHRRPKRTSYPASAFTSRSTPTSSGSDAPASSTANSTGRTAIVGQDPRRDSGDSADRWTGPRPSFLSAPLRRDVFPRKELTAYAGIRVAVIMTDHEDSISSPKRL